MPALPQQPQLPATSTSESPEGRWITSFVKSFQQLWFQLTYVLNTMLHVDTLANRPATPVLDETFFIASNTQQLFGASAGAWVNVGPRRGTADITNGATTSTVTLSPAEPDAVYGVTATPSYSTTIFVTAKVAGQFVINVGTAAVGAQTADWDLWRT